MKKRYEALAKAVRKHKKRLAWAIWAVGLALLAWGALFRTFEVLDKPTSADALKQGIRMKIYTEAQLVSAISTDRVELASDGTLKTVPDMGFCES